MRAYCWSTGLIEFGPTLPKGALPIARGRERKLRAVIEPLARHGYTIDRGPNGQLLVPGVPESVSGPAALAALERFISQVSKRTEPGDGLTVFTRAHRMPIDGKRRR